MNGRPFGDFLFQSKRANLYNANEFFLKNRIEINFHFCSGLAWSTNEITFTCLFSFFPLQVDASEVKYAVFHLIANELVATALVRSFESSGRSNSSRIFHKVYFWPFASSFVNARIPAQRWLAANCVVKSPEVMQPLIHFQQLINGHHCECAMNFEWNYRWWQPISDDYLDWESRITAIYIQARESLSTSKHCHELFTGGLLSICLLLTVITAN